jgi:hypothetical protein
MARVSYDVGRAVDALAVDDDTDRPQSLYVAAFRELEEAFEQFGQKGARRVVVFVDDLDRCLPANALDVLESMKLFFDLEGFVFVVGLDEAVVQRAVRARFADPAPRTGQVEPAAEPAPGGRVDEKLERDYVEKIFQVPYRLPAMVDRQLGDLLEAMYGEAGLPPSQADDFRDRVARYLAFVAVQGQVNPREVKRFLNTYTLQTLVRPELDRDTVLALQTLLFRADWRALYDAILADSPRFVATLTRYRDERDERAFEDLSPELAVLRPDLAEFLTSDPAAALSRHQSLDAYLSSLESTRVTTPPWLTAAYQELGRLRAETRRTLRLPEPDDADRVRLAGLCREVSSRLFSLTADTPSASVAETAAAGVTTLIGQLEAAGAELESLSATPERFRERLAEIADRLLATADRLYRALRTFR